MSDQIPSGNPAPASGESEKTVSYESHTKLLGEKKKRDEENRQLKERLEQYEQEKMEAEGKIKEAYEHQKKLTQEFKEKNVNLIKTVSNKAVKNQFKTVAEKLGCVDPDLAMSACSFDDLEITDDFEFDVTKLESKIQELTKSKPYLFNKNVKLPPDVIPGKGSIASKSLSDMSDEELKQLL